MVLLPFKKRIMVRKYHAVAVAPSQKSETKSVEEIGKHVKKLTIVSTVGNAKECPRGDKGTAEKKALTQTVPRKFFSINPIGECREVLHTELPMKKRSIAVGKGPVLDEHNRKLNNNKRVCAWNGHDDEKTRLKKPKTSAPECLYPPPESDLPVQFRNRIRAMNGTEPKLLIQKQLTESDLSKHYSRFAIPKGQLRATNFLTKEEHDIVDKSKGGSVEVTMLDPALREFKMKFTRWKMSNSFTYNLTSGWTEVLEKNKDLEQSDWMQLWCFQRHYNSCLALVHLRHGQGDVASSSGTGSAAAEEGTHSRFSGNTSSSQDSVVTQEEK